MNRRTPHRPRSAFTLVELLVVIAILGVLAGLSTTVVYKALRTAKEAAITAEMSQLESAFKAYKEQYGQYPPNMGDAAMYNSNTTVRQWRFNMHMRKFAPRSPLSYGGGGANGTSLHEYLLANTGNSYNYMVSVNGSVQKLDISTLDPAEALVFWLGGFPAPCSSNGQPLCSTKLIGFHANPLNPFMLDPYNVKSPLTFMQSRKAKLFDFDETRLVDNDQDGWLEYVPSGISAPMGGTPPYVYFDAGGYTYPWLSQQIAPFGGYPAAITGCTNSGNSSMMQNLSGGSSGSSSSGGGGGASGSSGGGSSSGAAGSGWGLAMPYASVFSQGTLVPAVWINPMGVQIVCSGLDGQYSQSATLRIPTYPSGVTYTGSGYSTASFYDPGELDNLTNFSPGELNDQVP